MPIEKQLTHKREKSADTVLTIETRKEQFLKPVYKQYAHTPESRTLIGFVEAETKRGIWISQYLALQQVKIFLNFKDWHVEDIIDEKNIKVNEPEILGS